MARDASLADLKARLCDRIEDVCRELLPHGSRGGKYWLARVDGSGFCLDGEHNLWVNLRGQVGTWHHASAGTKGDVLALVMLTRGCTNFREALDWARAFLGDGAEVLTPAAASEARAAAARRREAEVRAEAAALEKNRNRAFSHWLQASERLAATPVETYLRGRGIELSRLAKPPRAIRFAARHHTESERWWPSMLALISGPEGQPWAVHCTYLAEDGTAKAPVTPVRKMWPSFGGGAIRLSMGETGMRPTEAAKQGLLDTLCICEGVEDGLSIAMACPELRVWAACSLGNLGKIRLPTCCAEVIVAADNDWGKPQAAKLLEAGIAALSAQGRPVRVARSHTGKDANDALLSGGSHEVR